MGSRGIENNAKKVPLQRRIKGEFEKLEAPNPCVVVRETSR